MPIIHVNDDAKKAVEYFNWSIEPLLTLPELADAKSVIITDANLYYIYATVDGREAEIDCDGVVLFPNE